jgi:hypothetical protein
MAYVNGDPVNNIDIDGLYASNTFDGKPLGDGSGRLPGAPEEEKYQGKPKATIVTAEANYASLRSFSAEVKATAKADATRQSQVPREQLIARGTVVWPPRQPDVLRENTRFKEGTQYTKFEKAAHLGNDIASFASIMAIKKALKISTFTKSTLALGQQMHREYKVAQIMKNIRIKEFRLPSGKRIDFIDLEKGIIYELKPNNPRAIRQGYIQLDKYLQELKTIPRFKNINWKTILETY